MVSFPGHRRDNNIETSSLSDGGNDRKPAVHTGKDEKVTFMRFRVFAMVIIVSMGGLIFGFDTGQISGFLQMDDFINRFGDNGEFSNWKEGLIVGLLSIGTLFGALIAGPTADFLGRKKAIVVLNIVFIVGVVIQIATMSAWYQVAIGRFIAGLGVGGLSVMTPMYQAETAPRQIRGALISAYQLFITLGIFLAYCINYGTESRPDASSWRITMGIGFIFPLIMAVGIMFLPESPRWDFRHGRIEQATAAVAKSYGVHREHPEVIKEMREIREKFEAESMGGDHPWYEIFTGPRMAYRTALGMTLMSLQQLTGANYFFYYGTSVFAGIGIKNSFITSMILGGINFGSTFLGLYVVDHFGRRKSLITGGIWMFVCFLIFASIGHFKYFPVQDSTDPVDMATAHQAGIVMIVFTALFIFGYAITWGPIIWALVGEIFPSRYRAKSMGMATSANWLWNFLISFFTPYITSAIDFRYGYVFAACCFAGAAIVYFFVPESQGRSLEEIDTMYIMHVKPWKSSSWQPPAGEEYGETDRAYLRKGGRDIEKQRHAEAAAGGTAEQSEHVMT